MGRFFKERGDPISEWNQFPGAETVTFEALGARLVKQIRQRIHNGEFTERGLARILGISQSQTHNVLKGARTLQIQLADRILSKLGLSALDLLTEHELDEASKLRAAQWDWQSAPLVDVDLVEPEVDLPGLLATKRPAAQSAPRLDREERKAG